MSLFRRKSVDDLVDEATHRSGLNRTLGKLELTLLGIGAIIGAGIFSSVGTAIAGSVDRPGAGPALVLSLGIVTVVSALAALAYAEFASMIPAAGSAYTYAYATLGELIAWMIGWDLIIEYAIGNVAVAISWSGYFDTLLRGFGIHLPAWLVTDWRTAHQAAADLAAAADPATVSAARRFAAEAVATAPHLAGLALIFNLPAFTIVALITIILVIGIRESAWLNNIMVFVKIGVVLVFLAVGVRYVRVENWHPFMPNGLDGVTVGAAIIFFAYIGFDAVSTAAEETKNPQKDIPFGIITSLIVCTVLYVAIVLVLTGVMPWNQLGVPDPLAVALQAIHADWFAGIVAFGAVISMTSVLLVFQLGQPRIFFSMARDGLLPPWAAKVHPRFKTPHVTTILTGVLVAVPSLFFNIDEMVSLTNIGTFFAFILVSAGIIALRRNDPARPRPFRMPLVPVLPAACILICGYLMLKLPTQTWILFFVWMAIGLMIYFLYGRGHSRLNLPPDADLDRVKLHTKILLGLLLGAAAGIATNIATNGAVAQASVMLQSGASADSLAQLPAGAVTAERLNEYVMGPVGQIFLRMLFMVVVPLVFCSLALGVAGLGDVRTVGKLGSRTIFYFLATTALSATVGLVLVNLVQPGAGLPESVRLTLMETYRTEASQRMAQAQAADFGIETFVAIVPRNPVKAAADLDMLGIIFFALTFGAALTLMPKDKSEPVIRFLDGVGEAVVKIIGMAMKLAPYGVFGLIFVVTSRFGFALLKPLGLFVLTVLGGLAIHSLINISLIVRFVAGLNPLVFFSKSRSALITAFSTSSSSATLPTALKVAEDELKVSPKIAGFVLPLGSTMCMNGTALFEGVVVLFLAQVIGLHLSLGTQVIVIVLAVLTAVGAAGVPGGSIPLLVLVLQTVGIPGEYIAIVIGVDRLLDMCRTTVNVAGDLSATCVVAKWEGGWDPKQVTAMT